MKQVTILGSTGSIGCSTLDVLRLHPDRYRVFALTANRRVSEIFEQVVEFRPRYVVLKEPDQAEVLRNRLIAYGSDTEVLSGEAGLIEVANHPDVDYVMAAIVGAAGLLPTMAAAEAGKRVLLANKEALVMSGALLMNTVSRSGAELLPIDSEHNAIFQCLPYAFGGDLKSSGVRRVLLTGSGGPFRDWPLARFADVTPEQACAHPNWTMGRKISVDSATMMNKGLEYIEACWLFHAGVEQIEVVVHPQSVIHSMVEYVDGSVIAQMGNPDMRTPIAYGLGWPERMESGVPLLDLIKVGQLDFLAPDEQRFPCLRLAREAMAQGQTASVILNAANEVAVEAFLQGELRFSHIPVLIEAVLEEACLDAPEDIDVVLRADQEARRIAYDKVNGMKR